MGIDIFAKWRNKSARESSEQSEAWLSSLDGDIGCLREAYHGEPYATRFLFAEAFDSETCEARIPAAQLRENLEKALELVEERARKLYRATDEEVEAEKQSFRDFVALCEQKEEKTGEGDARSPTPQTPCHRQTSPKGFIESAVADTLR